MKQRGLIALEALFTAAIIFILIAAPIAISPLHPRSTRSNRADTLTPNRGPADEN